MKRKGRAPAVWNNDRSRQAFQLALLGATDKEIAEVMGVNEHTIDYWKRKNKDGFLDALNAGKLKADAKVAEGFYKRAVGFTIKETVLHCYKGEIIKTVIDKYYPPDPWAANKWMSIRQRDKWTEITKLETIQTTININKFDFSGLSTKELEVVKKLQIQDIKALGEHVGDN